MTMRRWRGAGRVLLFLVTATPSLLGAALNFGTSDVTGWNPGEGVPRTIGWEFVPQTALTVTRLGFVDQGQDGLLEGHTLAIWRLGGQAPLVVGTLGSGTAGELSGLFRYTDVTPTSLQAGVAYFILGSSTNADVWTWWPGCCWATVGIDNLVVDPRVALVAGGSVAGVFTTDVTQYPNYIGRDIGEGRWAFIGPNFEFSGAGGEIPEPAAYMLVGAGLAAVGLRMRRRAIISVN